MTLVVVDASVVAAWLIQSQSTVTTEQLYDDLLIGVVFVAPALFHFELRNAVLYAERRKTLPREEADRGLALLGHTTVRVEAPPDYGMIRRAHALARADDLTIYDAAYVELAERLGATLATKDKAMAASARKNGVSIIDAR